MIKLIIFVLYCMTAVQLQSLYRYEIIIDHLERPKADALFDYGTSRIKKFNRTTFVITGYCDILIPFSDDIVGQFTFYQFQGNEYRKIADRTITKMCTFYKEDKLFVPRGINQTSYRGKIKSCPIEPQRVYFYDTNVPADYLPVEPPKGEKYSFNIVYTLDGKILSNFSAYFSLKRLEEERELVG